MILYSAEDSFEFTKIRCRGVDVSRRQVNMMFEKPSIVNELILNDRLHPICIGKQERFDLEEVLNILPHFGVPRKTHNSLKSN